MITVLDMNGFKDARARSSSAFGIGLGYRPAIQQGGPTVTEALYEALKELEAQVIALQRSEGKGLLSRLS